MKKQAQLYLILVSGAVLLSALVLSVPGLRKFITTSMVQETTLNREVVITIPSDAPPGEHVFSINVEDGQVGDVLAQSEPVTIKVLPAGDDGEDEASGGGDGANGWSGSGGGGSGGDGGDGGGGGSGSEEGMAREEIKTYAFAPERGHTLVGRNTTVGEDQGRVVVRLAGNTSIVKKRVKVPRDNYYLYITARHDKPAPVEVAIYVDGVAWKIITMERGDDKYRLHQVGLLRNFANSEISFKFINDVYDRFDIANEATDRNFWFDAWALSTDPNLDRIKAPHSGLVKGVKTTGEKLLPRLNQMIREELGGQFVRWDIWSYYAPRLVAQPDRREAIGTEDRLRTVMKFWRSVSPQRPRGE